VQPFRKSGSFVRFFVDGETMAPEGDRLLAAIAEHRFRSIENAASEEVSAGWVCPSDPSGQGFLHEAIVQPPYIRLRMRLDKKRLPRTWLAIYLAAAVGERGGRISAKERKDLRAEIENRLLPRVLPMVRFVDVIWAHQARHLLLFSTSNPTGVECSRLFHKTFGARLVEAGPYEAALRLGLPSDQLRFLDEATQLSLLTDTTPAAPRRQRAPQTAQEATV
jgi:DNA recombination-dependent growth factor C